jgi:hypothetical protein
VAATRQVAEIESIQVPPCERIAPFLKSVTFRLQPRQLRGANYIFRSLKLPVQILKHVAEVILLLGYGSGVSEPVDSSPRPSIVRFSPDSSASPSISKLRSSGVPIFAPLLSRNLRKCWIEEHCT